MKHKERKLCFVALAYSYSLLLGETPEKIVGPDVHQVILGKALKMRYDISYISYNDKNSPQNVKYIDGIRIILIHRDRSRFKRINILLRVLRIWNAMRLSDSDIYLHAGGAAGVTSIFCKLASRKYVYSIASDALVDRMVIPEKVSGFSKSQFSLGNFGNWLDIKLADTIIVQNGYQKTRLRKNFSRNGTIMKMPFPLKVTHEKTKPPIVLWVGSMSDVKQPELFVKLAKAIPEAEFQMIGGHSGNQKLYDRMKDAAGKMPNLEFLGVVSFNEIDKYFGRASILANTSMFEGFPNAFVQAWMHHVPVISLNVDPDELLSESKLGFHSKTFGQMVEDIRTLLEDEKLRQEIGRNAREYVEREHDIDIIKHKYVEILASGQIEHGGS